MAEAAREDDDDEEETIEEDKVMEADASSDEDIASTSGRYSTQLSVEASIMSMDTSASSTMCTSLDDVEVCLPVCMFVCPFVYMLLCFCICPRCVCLSTSLGVYHLSTPRWPSS